MKKMFALVILMVLAACGTTTDGTAPTDAGPVATDGGSRVDPALDVGDARVDASDGCPDRFWRSRGPDGLPRPISLAAVGIPVSLPAVTAWVSAPCAGGGGLAFHEGTLAFGDGDLCAHQRSETPLPADRALLSITPLPVRADGEPAFILFFSDGTAAAGFSPCARGADGRCELRPITLPPEPSVAGASNGTTTLRISPPGADGRSVATCFPAPGAPPVTLANVYPTNVAFSPNATAVYAAVADADAPERARIATCSPSGFTVAAASIGVPAGKNAVLEARADRLLVAVAGGKNEVRAAAGIVGVPAGKEPVSLYPHDVLRDENGIEELAGVRGPVVPGGQAHAFGVSSDAEYVTAHFRVDGACAGIVERSEGGR